jgi:ribonuclease HI
MDIQGFLTKHGVTEWDVLIFGDGSGTGWKDAGGFACLIHTRAGKRGSVVGGVTNTTINSMELFAYIAGLRYHYYQMIKEKMPTPLKLHVFTDSAYVQNGGNGSTVVKSNKDLWNDLHLFRTWGYELTFHLVHRNSTPMHVWADQKAGEARRALLALRPNDTELYAATPFKEDKEGP